MSPAITVRRFEPADRARWDDYVRATPDSHFGQLSAWKDVTETAYGVPAHYWLAESAGRVRGVLPLFRKGGRSPQLFSAPGGLLADDDTVAAALIGPAREMLHREKLLWLELRDQRRGWAGLETSLEHLTMVLDLESTAEMQWKAFGAKLRNQIRKGEKSGFVRRWGAGEVAAFHKVMLENMRDLGTPLRAERYYRLVLEKLGGAADILVIADEGGPGEPVATMFTVSHGVTFADPWASSLRRQRARCPNQVLYWEALQRAIAKGARHFDFGRSQHGSGTYLFKEQWGARPVQLHYQYVLGTAPAIPTLAAQKSGFDLAVKVWQRLPVPLAGLLGEPAKRMFPEVM